MAATAHLVTCQPTRHVAVCRSSSSSSGTSLYSGSVLGRRQCDLNSHSRRNLLVFDTCEPQPCVVLASRAWHLCRMLFGSLGNPRVYTAIFARPTPPKAVNVISAKRSVLCTLAVTLKTTLLPCAAVSSVHTCALCRPEGIRGRRPLLLTISTGVVFRPGENWGASLAHACTCLFRAQVRGKKENPDCLSGEASEGGGANSSASLAYHLCGQLVHDLLGHASCAIKVLSITCKRMWRCTYAACYSSVRLIY